MDRPITARAIVDRQELHLDDRDYLASRRASYARHDGADDIARIAIATEKARPVFGELNNLPPNPLTGEDSRSFRLRQLSELKRHSPQYASMPLRSLGSFPQAAFDSAEDRIVADAHHAAKVWAPEGTLRERRIPQRGGHDIVEWAGDPRVWLDAFAAPGRVVTKFMRGNGDKTPLSMPRRSIT
jgi:hypothetical protein